MKKIARILSSGAVIFFSLFFINVAIADSTPIPSGLPLPGPQGGVVQILTNLVLWILTIFGIISIVGFFISGIQYIAASGNEAIIETAKRNIKYSIIGVIVGLSGYIVIKAVYAALTAQTFFF